MADNYSQFSRVVENYQRYRPHYPPRVIELLTAACGLTPEHIIADVGCGTGLLAERFLKHGNRVYGVEPNPEMRTAAEDYLRGYATFTSINGTAESTTLDVHSVDMITVGQAFHWFEPAATRREFERILQPGGWVVLVYNLEHDDGTPFAAAYGKLWLQIDPSVDIYARKRPDSIDQFYGKDACTEHIMPNEQVCDLDGLRGRILSASRSIPPDDPHYPAMLADIEAVFNQYHADGRVTLAYTTRVLYGQLAA